MRCLHETGRNECRAGLLKQFGSGLNKLKDVLRPVGLLSGRHSGKALGQFRGRGDELSCVGDLVYCLGDLRALGSS